MSGPNRVQWWDALMSYGLERRRSPQDGESCRNCLRSVGFEVFMAVTRRMAFNISKLCPQCICVFRTVLTANSDCFPTQH
jgi:hypothetical protein